MLMTSDVKVSRHKTKSNLCEIRSTY